MKKRAIGFRPPVKALPLVAQAPTERWATDLCRIWAGRDQLQRDWSGQTLLDLPCCTLFVWELGYLILDDTVIPKAFATAIEGLARTLRQVKTADLIHENQVRLCVIGDGAAERWRQVHERFPSAVEILDDYHCCEHLHKVASRQYGNRPPRQPERCEATVAWLLWGEVHRGVIWGLQRLQPSDAQVAEEIDELIGYVQRYRKRVDYRFARKGATPLKAVVASRRTSSSAMCASNARGPGGIPKKSIKLCSYAAPNTRLLSTLSLSVTANASMRYQGENLLKIRKAPIDHATIPRNKY